MNTHKDKGEIKKRYFPCWVCKGQGGEKEEVTDEGEGPYYECDYCKGEGIIEIGGKIHMEHKAFNIGCEILWQPGKNIGKEFKYKYIVRIGKKALALIK